jgi:hypothetical protein
VPGDQRPRPLGKYFRAAIGQLPIPASRCCNHPIERFPVIFRNRSTIVNALR